MRESATAAQISHVSSWVFSTKTTKSQFLSVAAREHKKKKRKDASSKKKMLPAQVEAVEWIGERFRLIDILAEGCRGAKWQPVAKLKIDIGDGMTRTFTPIAINAK
jgi:hypothetical protein